MDIKRKVANNKAQKNINEHKERHTKSNDQLLSQIDGNDISPWGYDPYEQIETIYD